MSVETISTPITEMFGIKYPILLAGMNVAAGPNLAAAVCNAGGLGVMGGHKLSPRLLQITINNFKEKLKNKNSPFGIDLLIPKVGGNARKTNYDYNRGQLDELIDIVIKNGASLFVSAVGVPPKHVVDKLHKHNIYVMNMVGHPRHVKRACAVGVDLICAQGGEAGGHTGSISTGLLLPKCVDVIRENNFRSPLTGKPVYVVGAGGIYCGRSLAMALSLGCEGVWIGTRFVACTEAGATDAHKQDIINSSYDDTTRTLVYTGRPLRVIKNDYQQKWDNVNVKRRDELLSQGIIPFASDSIKQRVAGGRPHLCGQVCGAINKILTAKQIIDNIMTEAVQVLKENHRKIKIKSLHSKL